MGDTSVATQVAAKWRKKRGSLIMALHEIQDVKGYVPWEDALEIARAMNIPLARIYEVLTFYNFFQAGSTRQGGYFGMYRNRLLFKKETTKSSKNLKRARYQRGRKHPRPHFSPAMRPLRRLLRPGAGMRGQRKNIRSRNRRRCSQHH